MFYTRLCQQEPSDETDIRIDVADLGWRTMLGVRSGNSVGRHQPFRSKSWRPACRRGSGAAPPGVREPGRAVLALCRRTGPPGASQQPAPGTLAEGVTAD
jgi:hypothetical protein